MPLDVRFRTRRLQRCFEQSEDAARSWGPEVGRRYIQRVAALLAAERVSDLYNVRALDLRPLTGDRRGQYAIRLTGQMRVIITVEDERSVIIEEVVDYHG